VGIFVRGRGVRSRVALLVSASGWRVVAAGASLAEGAPGFGEAALTLALSTTAGRVCAWLDGARVAETTLPADTPSSGAAGVIASRGTVSVVSLRLTPAGGGG
jgi:hypothetical protein